MNVTKIKIYGREKGGGFFRDYICSFMFSKYLLDIQVDNGTIYRIERTKEDRRQKIP